MTSEKSGTHRWGLGLEKDELSLIGNGEKEIDITRSRMPLLSVGDTIKLVDWDTDQECAAEVLKRIAVCNYRVRITGGFEPISKSPTDQDIESRKVA